MQNLVFLRIFGATEHRNCVKTQGFYEICRKRVKTQGFDELCRKPCKNMRFWAIAHQKCVKTHVFDGICRKPCKKRYGTKKCKNLSLAGWTSQNGHPLIRI